MSILVLGGTRFVGRAIVECAISQGFDVTILNRGRTNDTLFPQVEHLVGDRDRDGDLDQLNGRHFDYVIDTSGYFPRQVRAVVEALDNDIDHYSFVSSVSVYADHSSAGADESAELATVTDPLDEQLGANYGGFKAMCEAVLDEMMPGRVHHVRAGLVIGPHDYTGRFTYWVKRIASGGTVLAPGPRDLPVQLIDVADLASWILKAATRNIAGAINATGVPGAQTMSSMLNTINAVVGPGAEFEWVGADFLHERGLRPLDQVPLWVPSKLIPTHAGFMCRSNSRALELGLALRPLADTVVSVQQSTQTRGESVTNAADHGPQVDTPGLEPAEEQALLRQWRSVSGEDGG